jgi:hypothetical protein
MNDLQTLYEAWGAPDAPSPTACAQARAALLARTKRRRSSRRRGLRLAAIGATALAGATGMILASDIGGDGRPQSGVPGLPSVPVASAAVLERAARHAAAAPFTPPREHQWFYFEAQFAGSEGSELRRTWRRADGGAMAWLDGQGKLEVRNMELPKRRRALMPPAFGPLASYKALAALPTDPDALLRWAYELAKNIEGAGLTEDGDVYSILNGILSDNVLPPELEAGIFRAIKKIPGVNLEEVEVLGHHVLSLSLTEGWLRQELLLDPDTYAYRGQRSTVVKDAVISPEKAGNATGEIHKGHVVIAIRLVTAIVDEAGQTG